MKVRNGKTVFVLAAALLMATVLLCLCLGSVRLAPQQILLAVKNGPIDANGRIFWYARLPRTVACLLSGAALAVSGAVIQGVLANKLASPGIIGVNAGAGLAVTICCAVGAVGGWSVAAAAFAGALTAVLMITFAAQKTGASRTTVVLGGVAVNSFLNAVTEGITVLIPEAGMMTADFRVGGFSSVAYTRLIPAAVLIVIGLAVVFTLCNELDLLAMGEHTAQGLGLSVKKMRTVFLLLAALLAGASVTFAGLLGFVGLIVPHMVRNAVGGESCRLLPLCALLGSCFVALCDLLARTVFSPQEIPVGIFMAVLGGPFFVLLLIKSKGRRSNG